MRQFVLGLLVAVVAWWGYGRWFAGSASAEQHAPGAGEPSAADGNGSPAAPPSVPLGQVLGTPAAGAPRAREAALDSSVAVPPVQLDDLLPRVGQRELAAVDQGWSLLAAPSFGRERSGADRARLAASLASGGDFASLLASLGSFNTFLHSAEGRAHANKALAAAMAMPDEASVPAGSQLLALCLRGRIEKGDQEARAFVDEAYRQHRVRVDRWLCDPTNVARARSYTVAAGDSLARIAGRFRRDKVLVDDGTLAILNRIHNPNSLQPGQKIKVPVDPVRAVVEKRSFSLAVYVGDCLLRLYWVGHGENDRTPVAEFTVGKKLAQPEWTAPGGRRFPYGHPENILGEYFLQFLHSSHTGFGAHGTPMPETIGTMSSMGCIRMLAPDIAELFQLLPRGASVDVRATAPLP